MDPLTHATLGIAVALAVAPRSAPVKSIALAGLAAGMLPDADILLHSDTDPLFSLEYHRHFTHSIAFSPVIAVLGAAIAWLMLRCLGTRPLFLPMLVPAWLAGLSHLICDLWTSYGTRIGWPLSDHRAALDWISVIDPLFTLPLLAGTLVALLKARPRHARQTLIWASLYLTVCVIQHERASHALKKAFASEGLRQPDRIAVHPSFANILVWRALAEQNGTVRAIAIRCGLGTPTLLQGESSPVFNHPDQAIATLQLDPATPQARDVRRFFHFSGNWVAVVPGEANTLGDLRYSTLPDTLAPLWGIRLNPAGATPSVEWRTFRTLNAATWNRFFAFIIGDFNAAPVTP